MICQLGLKIRNFSLLEFAPCKNDAGWLQMEMEIVSMNHCQTHNAPLSDKT